MTILLLTILSKFYNYNYNNVKNNNTNSKNIFKNKYAFSETFHLYWHFDQITDDFSDSFDIYRFSQSVPFLLAFSMKRIKCSRWFLLKVFFVAYRLLINNFGDIQEQNYTLHLFLHLAFINENRFSHHQ